MNTARLDNFLIWANGLDYLDSILTIIEKDYKIVFVKEINIDNVEQFVNFIYDCDTVPIEHLAGKTKYLLDLEPKAVYVLVENQNPIEQMVGEGDFRHIQSMTLNRTKQVLRGLFNPTKDHHIIHGSDYQSQVKYILYNLFSIPPKDIYVPPIDVYKILRNAPEYCLLRPHSPLFRPGGDLDILCRDVGVFDNYLVTQGDFITTTSGSHVHVDLWEGDSLKFRFDLIGDFEEAPGLAGEVLNNTQRKHRLYVPTPEYDAITKGHEFSINRHKTQYEPFYGAYLEWKKLA